MTSGTQHSPSPVDRDAAEGAVRADSPGTRRVLGRSWLRPLLVANLLGQMFIIVSGGLVRLTGSGLGCPTWPQCVPGSFTPVAEQEQGWHSAVEFGNRLVTWVLVIIAGLLLIEAVRWARGDRRFVWLAAVPALGVVLQAVVGGIIVLTHLDPKTVSPHFLISIGLVAYSAWLLDQYHARAHRRLHGLRGARVIGVPPLLRKLVWIAAALAAVVIVLGTAVTGSGPHSGDAAAEVRFGFDPATTAWLHADSVMGFLGVVVGIVIAGRLVAVPAVFRRRWDAVLWLILLQGVVGYTQFFLKLPILLVLVHLLLSAVLTALVTFAVCSAWDHVDEAQADPAAEGSNPVLVRD